MAEHTHAHSHGEKKSLLRASKTCRLSTVLLLTIGFFFVELVCGYMLHSVAIVADAIHMLSDSGALIIAMVSVRVCYQGFLLDKIPIFCCIDCKTKIS
jgi:Co/Zn/Cd efflux system component